MAVSSDVQDEGLVRVIGTGALGLSVVNMVVGAGIFVYPGLIAAELGSAAILAYLVCSMTVALVFLCFAEVGSRVSRSGGAYAYIEGLPYHLLPTVARSSSARYTCDDHRWPLPGAHDGR